jgi:hypothetical protein
VFSREIAVNHINAGGNLDRPPMPAHASVTRGFSNRDNALSYARRRRSDAQTAQDDSFANVYRMAKHDRRSVFHGDVRANLGALITADESRSITPCAL